MAPSKFQTQFQIKVSQTVRTFFPRHYEYCEGYKTQKPLRTSQGSKERKLILIFPLRSISPKTLELLVQIYKAIRLQCIGESENGCFKKTKHVKCSKNKNFLPLIGTHLCVSVGKKYLFFGKFGVFLFY